MSMLISSTTVMMWKQAKSIEPETDAKLYVISSSFLESLIALPNFLRTNCVSSLFEIPNIAQNNVLKVSAKDVKLTTFGCNVWLFFDLQD